MTAPVPEAVIAALGTPLSAAATLGRRTAEMHLALGTGAHRAFAPEPFKPLDATRTADAVAGRAKETIDLLLKRRASLDDALQPMVDRVRESAALLPRLRSLAGVADAGARIRTHGDYHLGQLLWTEEDFVILDFEGEPARPLQERRAKESPLRDVAGMIRSFGYVASVGSQAASRRTQRSEPLIDAWADMWETWVAAVFLQTYVTTLRGSSLVPTSLEDFSKLLNLFVIEKAFYELRYELNNRPDWVHVPLRTIARLM
jgi:maltose alpha-D-glucosyltransferase/alpha-amylase